MMAALSEAVHCAFMMPVSEWRTIPCRTCVSSWVSTRASRAVSSFGSRASARIRPVKTVTGFEHGAYGKASARVPGRSSSGVSSASSTRRTGPASGNPRSRADRQRTAIPAASNAAPASSTAPPVNVVPCVLSTTVTVGRPGSPVTSSHVRRVQVDVIPTSTRSSERGGADRQRGLTGILRAWAGGEQAALERLAPLVCAELRRLAKQRLRREAPGHAWQTTALVNEAWVRLLGGARVGWQDRGHFFAVASRIMRRILVDAARARLAANRRGDYRALTLNESIDAAPPCDGELVALDDALTSLAKVDARKARVVEMRFFAGLSVEETARLLRVSPQTVMRDWRLARVWLTREMNPDRLSATDSVRGAPRREQRPRAERDHARHQCGEARASRRREGRGTGELHRAHQAVAVTGNGFDVPR